MRHSLRLALPLLLLAAPAFRAAEEPTSPLSVGGKVRLRGEDWSNFGFRADQDDTFLLYRAFLHAQLRLAPGAGVWVEAPAVNSAEKNCAPVRDRGAKWSGWDLNPRSIDYESTALTD